MKNFTGICNSRSPARLIRRSGLILFCLLAVFCAGLWAGNVVSDIGHVSRQLYSDVSGNHVRLFETDIKAATRLKWHGTNFRLAFAYTDPNGDIAWGDVNKFNVRRSTFAGRIIPFQKKLQSKIDALFFKNKVTASFDVTSYEWSGPGYSVGITLAPSRSLLFRISRGRDFLWPAFTELYYQYSEDSEVKREGGEVHLDTPLWSTDVSIILRPLSRFRISMSLRDGRFIPDNEFVRKSGQPVYDGLVDGIISLGQISGRYGLTGVSSVSAGYCSGRSSNRLRLYEDGHKFAHFGELDITAHMLHMSFTSPDHTFFIRAGSCTGSVAGSLEAWPFMDGLARYVGERRHLRGTGELEFYNVSIRNTVGHIDRVRIRTGADFLRLLPELSYVSWRPVFMGFGVDDLQKSEIDIERVDLLQVSLQSDMQVYGLRLEGTISQWVPLSVSRPGEDGAGGGGAADGSPGVSEDTNSSGRHWNGLSVSVRMTAKW